MKTLSVVLKRCLAIFLALVMVLLSITTAAALVLAHNYSNMISMALGQSNVKITNAAGTEYYASDYASEAEMQSAAAALCRDIEREGMVLLKNTDNALPLPSGARVSLFSQNSVDLVYGGAGAGSVDASAAPDLKTVLEAAGFAVNPVLWDFYSTGAGSAYRKEVPNLLGAGNFAAHEPPQSLFTQEVTDSLGDYGDAAIVVIGRSGSESVDLPVGYLSLTAEEEALIQLAGERFETVILLLNATNPMPLPVLDAEGVDACLWVGALGQEGAWVIGEALSGVINPSGRLVDTWAYDPGSVPAAANLGDYTISNSAVEAGNKYMVYAENIYVGYRYYETRYEDALLGQGNAGQFNYDAQVQFPFGYGLSYTQFEWSDFPNFGYCDIREGLAAGNDLWLNTGWNMWNLKDNELTPAVQRQSRTALQRYLYAVVNSNAMNGIGEGTSTKNVWASWQWLQIPVVIVILLLDVGCVLAFRRLWGIQGKRAKPRT